MADLIKKEEMNLVRVDDLPFVIADGVYDQKIINNRIHMLMYITRSARDGGVEHLPVQELAVPLDWLANNLMQIIQTLTIDQRQKFKALM